MTHLILFAHPKIESFNHAILQTLTSTLEERGDSVIVRDLYALDFAPVLTQEDMEALRKGQTPEDIAQEQHYITQADTLIFVYPLWWTGLPAILKGYVDRVFSYGFAYRYNQAGEIEGLLKGKKGFLVTTHGTPNAHYDSTGMTQALKETTDSGIFNFCGITEVNHLFFGAVPSVDDKARHEMLAKVRESAKEL